MPHMPFMKGSIYWTLNIKRKEVLHNTYMIETRNDEKKKSSAYVYTYDFWKKIYKINQKIKEIKKERKCNTRDKEWAKIMMLP